jgi:hypothetical protein
VVAAVSNTIEGTPKSISISSILELVEIYDHALFKVLFHHHRSKLSSGYLFFTIN